MAVLPHAQSLSAKQNPRSITSPKGKLTTTPASIGNQGTYLIGTSFKESQVETPRQSWRTQMTSMMVTYRDTIHLVRWLRLIGWVQHSDKLKQKWLRLSWVRNHKVDRQLRDLRVLSISSGVRSAQLSSRILPAKNALVVRGLNGHRNLFRLARCISTRISRSITCRHWRRSTEIRLSV